MTITAQRYSGKTLAALLSIVRHALETERPVVAMCGYKSPAEVSALFRRFGFDAWTTGKEVHGKFGGQRWSIVVA